MCSLQINRCPGHWHPLVPLAQALESAGHEVAFAPLPGFGTTIEAKGFRTFAVGVDETPEEAQQIGEELARSTRCHPRLVS